MCVFVVLCQGSAPRIQCLDDYYMTEKDVMVYDETVGREVKRQVLEYEVCPASISPH